MNISEFSKWDMDEAQAYVIGLIYPLFKHKNVNGKYYLIGSVNHNQNAITKDELDKHFLRVNSILKKSKSKVIPEIKANKSNGISISPKAGFSILVETLEYSEKDILDILDSKVEIISKDDSKIKKQFVIGCFDGRSSWDKTAKFLSIDVDRDLDRQSKIEKIITSLGIEVNINNRGEGHKKNDQIRIKSNSIEKFLIEIGLYSICRLNIINRELSKEF